MNYQTKKAKIKIEVDTVILFSINMYKPLYSKKKLQQKIPVLTAKSEFKSEMLDSYTIK